ncbi:MAG: carboxypeptidase regulatory-like domain-containing protein [Vicinamibacterales bacterium]
MHRWAWLLICFISLASVSAQDRAVRGPAPPSPPPVPTPDARRSLPVSKVVLYRSGVGYFEHLGTVTGNEGVTIQFTSAQLDDVLKSLTATDLGDGHVTGVSYDSPTPLDRRLRALRLPLDASASTLDFLSALRGARVEVQLRGGATITGRMFAVERQPRSDASKDDPVTVDEVTIVTDRGEVVIADLPGTRVRIVDGDLRREVNQFLDVAGSARDQDVRRMMISTTGPGTRQLFVSYVSEAAVWKATYRLIFPTKGDRPPSLQGWAIVDNTTGEDWDAVELSLLAGAPQSFVQTLSQPLFTRRPVVPLPAGLVPSPQVHDVAVATGFSTLRGTVTDTAGSILPGVTLTLMIDGAATRTSTSDANGRYEFARIPSGTATLEAELQGFTSFESAPVALPPGLTVEYPVRLSVGALSETMTVSSDSPAEGKALAEGGADEPFGASPPVPVPAPALPELLEQKALETRPTADAGELGELFEYRLKDRVTIRRNQSALVPILQAEVKAERVSLWNASTGAQPRRAVWLENASGLTLAPGSISVVDAGAFGGEGLMDSMKPGERRLVSFATDLAVVVAATPESGARRVLHVAIAKGVLTRRTEDRESVSYAIRNQDKEPRVVVIEHPVRNGWQLTGDTLPAESTASTHRFRATVPPNQTLTLKVDEVRTSSSAVALTTLTPPQLSLLVEGFQPQAGLQDALKPVFAKQAEIATLELQLRSRQADLRMTTDDQARVRENMKALQRSDSERRLLERYTRQLDEQETKLQSLQGEMRSLTERRQAAAGELEVLIEALTIELSM